MSGTRDLLSELLPDYNPDAEPQTKLEPENSSQLEDPCFLEAETILANDDKVLDELKNALNHLDKIVKGKKEKYFFDDDMCAKLAVREQKCLQVIQQGIALIAKDKKRLQELAAQTQSPLIKNIIRNRSAFFGENFKKINTRFMQYKVDSMAAAQAEEDEPQQPAVSSSRFQQMIELEDKQAHARERHERILKLARSVNELADLFHQLDFIIEEQGEMLNRIDAHIEHALVQTKKGTDDVQAAKKYQDKSLTGKLIVGLTVVTAGLATAVALKRR